MASTTTDREAALRESVLNLLNDPAYASQSSGAVERAIARALSVFHSAASQYAFNFNRSIAQSGWNGLPAELKLEVVRHVPPLQCVRMLMISRETRALLLSDPSLWTNIKTPPLAAAARAKFLRTMLARSGCCPVDITWMDPWHFLSSLPTPPRDAIIQALPRVRNLILDVSYCAPGHSIFSASSAPLLEKLAFRHPMNAVFCCTISPDAFSGHFLPALRELILPTITIVSPPRSPFDSVLSLHVNIAGMTSGIQWFWSWFPRLQTLVVYICGNDAPLIPPPPTSLRHVIVYPASRCKALLRVLDGWTSHGIRLIESFGPDDAMDAGLALLNSHRALSASFAPICQPRSIWRNAAIVRCGEMTLALWSKAPYEQRLQIRTPALLDRLEALTLAGPGVFELAFRDDIAFPALRSLTAMGVLDVPCIFFPSGPTLRAPALEEIVVDLTSEAAPKDCLDLIAVLVRRIEHTRKLLRIVICLPDNFERQSPALGDITRDLALVALDVRVEYHPATRCGQRPCFCSAVPLGSATISL